MISQEPISALLFSITASLFQSQTALTSQVSYDKSNYLSSSWNLVDLSAYRYYCEPSKYSKENLSQWGA